MNNLPNLNKLPNQDFWTQGNDSDPFGRKNHERQLNKSVADILGGLDAQIEALLEKNNGLV